MVKSGPRMSVECVIDKEEQLLRTNSVDAAHDLDHHKCVTANCIWIAEQEGLEVDMDAVRMAAMLHDFERRDDQVMDDSDTELRTIMTSCGYSEPYIEKVLQIKNGHTFGRGQETPEQQLLFDADKLEYLNEARFRRVFEAVERGEMTAERSLFYSNLLRERLPHVLGMLHFETARQEFVRRFDQAKVVANNKLGWEWMAEANLDH